MSGQRVLEIQQPEVGDAVTTLDQHDVLVMIIPQKRDWAEPVTGNRLEHLKPRPNAGSASS